MPKKEKFGGLKMSSKQKAETIHQSIFQPVTSSATSCTFLKKTLVMGVSTITYLRGFFEESAFVVKKVADIPVHIIKPDNENKHAEWIMSLLKGACDAIDKGFLRELVLGVYKDPKNIENSFTETFNFIFEYGVVKSMAFSHMKDGQSMKEVQMNLTSEDLEGICKTLFRKLIVCCSSMEKLDDHEKKFTTMKLFYHEHTPDDYSPPGFRHADSSEYKFLMDSKPKALHLGHVVTKWHAMKVEVKSLKLVSIDAAENLAKDSSIESNRIIPAPVAFDDEHFNSGLGKQNSLTEQSGKTNNGRDQQKFACSDLDGITAKDLADGIVEKQSVPLKRKRIATEDGETETLHLPDSEKAGEVHRKKRRSATEFPDCTRIENLSTPNVPEKVREKTKKSRKRNLELSPDYGRKDTSAVREGNEGWNDASLAVHMDETLKLDSDDGKKDTCVLSENKDGLNEKNRVLHIDNTVNLDDQMMVDKPISQGGAGDSIFQYDNGACGDNASEAATIPFSDTVDAVCVENFGVHCPCGANSYCGELMLQCEECKTYQHPSCFLAFKEDDLARGHFCMQCSKKMDFYTEPSMAHLTDSQLQLTCLLRLLLTLLIERKESALDVTKMTTLFKVPDGLLQKVIVQLEGHGVFKKLRGRGVLPEKTDNCPLRCNSRNNKIDTDCISFMVNTPDFGKRLIKPLSFSRAQVSFQPCS